MVKHGWKICRYYGLENSLSVTSTKRERKISSLKYGLMSPSGHVVQKIVAILAD